MEHSIFSFLNYIGVRQGSVLSPRLFTIYLNHVASCLTIRQRHYIVLYSDDILIIASSLTEMQRVVSIGETELCSLDTLTNAKKSACMRIGPRHNVTIVTRICLGLIQ